MQSIWSPSVANAEVFCPSCGARRMVECATLLVDEVLPHQPMRQWVLSVPFLLRFLFASQPKIMGMALGIVSTGPPSAGQKWGTDSGNSVANSYGQIHEVPILIVSGPGLFPTSGGVNPTFTITALALRSANHLLENWPD